MQMRCLNADQIANDAEALDPIDAQALAFMQLADTSKALSLLLRYQSDHNRRYHRAMRQLISIRSKGVFSGRTEIPNEPRTASNSNTAKQQTGPRCVNASPQLPATPRPVVKIDEVPKVFTQTA